MRTNKPYLQLFDEAFPGLNANIARCEKVGFEWVSKPYLKEVAGEAVSHVGFLEYPVQIDGKKQVMGALHAICTKASHRGQGFAKALIQEVLQFAKDRYDCLLLFTEIPEFYEKIGFSAIQEHRFHLTYPHPTGSKPLRDRKFNCF